jgi:hypothetical protein
MRFTLEINMDGATFEDDWTVEAGELLRAVAYRLGERTGIIHDSNGNSVGAWIIEGDRSLGVDLIAKLDEER